MGYLISLMIMATIAIYSVFFIFRDNPKNEKNWKSFNRLF